jgi:hypothetical protein
MKKYSILLACLAGLVLLSTGLTKPVTPPEGKDKNARDASRERIESLVKQLAAERFSDREEAQKELEKIGAAAMETLRKTAKDGEPEVSRRAAEIIRRIEERALADSVLTPKKVKLSFKDTPVVEAVAELAKQSGHVVEVVEGDRVPLKERKITLETGEVMFWEALDQLCAKGSLVEKTIAQGGLGPFNQPMVFPNVPLQPMPGNPGLLPPPMPLQIPMGGFQLPMVPNGDPAQIKKQMEEQLKKQLEQLDKQKKQIEEQLKKLQQGGQAAPAPQPLPPQGAAQGGPADIAAMMKAMEAQMQANMKAMEANMQARMNQMQAQVQVQIQQIQPGQPGKGGAPGLPGAPGMPGGMFPPGFPGGGVFQPGFPMVAPNQGNPQKIVLADGKPLSVPTSYAGSVRIRLLPPASVNMQANAGETLLVFELSAEPRLQVFRPQGAPNIIRVKDDQGQNLTTVEQPAAPQANPGPFQFPQIQPGNPFGVPAQQRFISVRLKLGQKKAEFIKELTGTISAEVKIPPEPVITIDNVLQAKGKTVKGKNGDSLTLKNIDKVGDDYRVEFSREAAAPNAIGGNGGIQIQIGGPFGMPGIPALNQDMPNLVDVQGNKYQIVNSNSNSEFANGAVKSTSTIVYHADAGQGAPTRLVLTEPRVAAVAVPFEFRNVKLP